MFGTERPDLALSAPPAYRATRGDVHAAVPALDWWRGFRSAELTRFIEEAQTESFDIGAAIGRILQADAQSKIASAPLLPTAAFAGTGARLKGAGVPEKGDYRVVLNAAYEMDFWGKNRAASLAAEENTVVARFSKEVVVLSTIVSVGTAYLQILASQDHLTDHSGESCRGLAHPHVGEAAGGARDCVRPGRRPTTESGRPSARKYSVV